jgi:hypothetical protein
MTERLPSGSFSAWSPVVEKMDGDLLNEAEPQLYRGENIATARRGDKTRNCRLQYCWETHYFQHWPWFPLRTSRQRRHHSTRRLPGWQHRFALAKTILASNSKILVCFPRTTVEWACKGKRHNLTFGTSRGKDRPWIVVGHGLGA